MILPLLLTFTLLTHLASSLPVADNAHAEGPTPGIFEFTLERNQATQSNTTLAARQVGADRTTFLRKNGASFVIVMRVDINQEMKMEVDTGSALSFLYIDSCTTNICAQVGPRYLFKMRNAPPAAYAVPDLPLLDGTSVTGTWVERLFRIPSVHLIPEIPDGVSMTFLAAHDGTSRTSAGVPGRLGLGMNSPNLPPHAIPFWKHMEPYLAQPVFAFYFGENGRGRFTVGAWFAACMSTPPKWAAVYDKQQHYWNVPFGGFYVNGVRKVLTTTATTGMAIVDTHTPFASGPSFLVAAFYLLAFGGCEAVTLDQVGVCRLDDLPAGWESLTVGLQLGDEVVQFPVSALVRTSEGQHYGTVELKHTNQCTFGLVFLTHIYTIFDGTEGRERVGFSQKSLNGC